MKKIFFIFLNLLLCSFLFAQSDFSSVVQVIVPHEVYIGDSGQIQYSFRSPVDFFALAGEEYKNSDEINLKLTPEDFLEDPQALSVSRTALVRNGVNYNICISFVPWKTGKIDFKEFDLEAICKRLSSIKQENSANKYLIKFESVNVPSLSQKLNVTTMRGAIGPLLVPGTTYFIWLFSILILIIVCVVVLVIVKIYSIIAGYKAFIQAAKSKRNVFLTVKKLKFLLRKKIEDSVFAEQFQKILRKYLNKRYGISFDSVSSRFMKNYIHRAVEENGEEFLDEGAVELLIELFVRTDYIRFARNSIQSKMYPREKYSVEFLDGEKLKSVASAEDIIRRLEIKTIENKIDNEEKADD